MIRMLRVLFAALACAALAGATARADILIDFDAVPTFDSVDEFYNGGTSSSGAMGPNLGVSFTAGDWLTTTGFGETSQPNLAYSNGGAGEVNVAAGFATQISFTYGAFSDSSLSIYSGLNGGGTLLATGFLAANNPNAFDPFTIAFAGTAESIVVSAGGGQLGLDDLRLGAPLSVPEPSALISCAIGGLSLAGYSLRRRKNAA
jgi:hypothetical protein